MPGYKTKNCDHKTKTRIFVGMLYACSVAISFLSPVTAYAETTDLKQGAHQAGQEVGSTVHKIGQAGKDVGLGIAHEAVDIGHAVKAGAVGFWNAASGKTSPPAESAKNRPVTGITKSQEQQH